MIGRNHFAIFASLSFVMALSVVFFKKKNIFTSSANASSEAPWRQVPNDLPWFDRPDALQILETRKAKENLDETTYELLKKWVTDGYVIVQNMLPNSDIDQMVSSLDAIWEDDTAVPGLTLLDVKPPNSNDLVNIAHSDLIKFSKEERQKMRFASNWRIHGYYTVNDAANRIYQNKKLIEITSLIFNKTAIPSASINFMRGSAQEIHQDMGVFHIHPNNYLIGAWIACEDISPDSGPMFYYPKSHKVPQFPGFTDYPQTNLRTYDRSESHKYHEYLTQKALDYKREHFTPKKGEVLLWHGMLLHGGSHINNPALSRKSYVIHYMTEGVNRKDEVTGPFNW